MNQAGLQFFAFSQVNKAHQECKVDGGQEWFRSEEESFGKHDCNTQSSEEFTKSPMGSLLSPDMTSRYQRPLASKRNGKMTSTLCLLLARLGLSYQSRWAL
jgi:hypothetical protein